MRALLRATHIASGTGCHHLRVLGRFDEVWSRPFRGKRLYFPGREPPSDLADVEVALVGMPVSERAVLAAVVASPRCSQTALFAALPTMPRSTVQNALYRLIHHGLITAHRQVRVFAYEPTAALRQARAWTRVARTPAARVPAVTVAA